MREKISPMYCGGAPLDNNVCERALEKAILHRKNALFYRTINGAHVGDLFMSLIHTAELGGVNPFDYLTELPRYPRGWRKHLGIGCLGINGKTSLKRPISPPERENYAVTQACRNLTE